MTDEEAQRARQEGTWLRYTGDAFRWQGVIVRAIGRPYRPSQGLSLNRRSDKPMRVAVMDSKSNRDDMPIADLRPATPDELDGAGL